MLQVQVQMIISVVPIITWVFASGYSKFHPISCRFCCYVRQGRGSMYMYCYPYPASVGWVLAQWTHWRFNSRHWLHPCDHTGCRFCDFFFIFKYFRSSSFWCWMRLLPPSVTSAMVNLKLQHQPPEVKMPRLVPLGVKSSLRLQQLSQKICSYPS